MSKTSDINYMVEHYINNKKSKSIKVFEVPSEKAYDLDTTYFIDIINTINISGYRKFHDIVIMRNLTNTRNIVMQKMIEIQQAK